MNVKKPTLSLLTFVVFTNPNIAVVSSYLKLYVYAIFYLKQSPWAWYKSPNKTNLSNLFVAKREEEILPNNDGNGSGILTDVPTVLN